MRRIVTTLGIAVLGLSLTIGLISCGQSGSDSGPAQSNSAGASSQPAVRARIGVSVPAADHGWTAGVIYWAGKAMALHPEIDWQFQTAQTGQEQVSQIEAMLANGIDGLVVLPQDVDPVTKVAKEAHDRGVYVVNVDRGFTEPVADVHIEGDNKLYGRRAAEYVASKMGGKGNLVILEGMVNQVNTDRVEAAKAVFAEHPDIKILADQEADWNHEKALSVMQAILTQNPHIDAVWAQDDDNLLGAVQAIKEAGRQKEMWVLGGAGMKEVVKMVMDKDPMVPADITYPPSMIATGIHFAASALRDGKETRDGLSKFLPRHLIQDVDLVTPENASQFYFPDSVF